MAGHGGTLEFTPTWIVAVVCSLIVLISLLVERCLHYLGKTFKRKNQKPLYEAILRIKEELMLLGFISLLLTVFQRMIQKTCIRPGWTLQMLPCQRWEEDRAGEVAPTKEHFVTAQIIGRIGRRLLSEGAAGAEICQKKASELNRSIFDGSDALSYDPGTEESDSKLREAMKKIMNRCRKLVGMLGCASSADVHVPGRSMGTLASSSHAGRGSSSHAASSSRIVEEAEGEDDEEQAEGKEEGGGEEEYDDDDGPPPTQPTQDKRGKQPKKNWQSPSPFLRDRTSRRTNKPDETRSKKNEERTAKRGRRPSDMVMSNYSLHVELVKLFAICVEL